MNAHVKIFCLVFGYLSVDCVSDTVYESDGIACVLSEYSDSNAIYSLYFNFQVTKIFSISGRFSSQTRSLNFFLAKNMRRWQNAYSFLTINTGNNGTRLIMMLSPNINNKLYFFKFHNIKLDTMHGIIILTPTIWPYPL